MLARLIGILIKRTDSGQLIALREMIEGDDGGLHPTLGHRENVQKVHSPSATPRASKNSSRDLNPSGSTTSAR